MNFAARKAATTTPIARTTKRAGTTGAVWKSTAEIFRFTRGMIAFRRAHPILSKEQFYTDTEIHWFGPHGGSPNWSDPNAKQFACLIHEDERNSLYLMFNAWAEAADFGLPLVLPGLAGIWPSTPLAKRQQDLFAAGEEPLWEDPRTYHLSPRSSAILLARQTNTQERLVTMKDAK